MASDEQVFKFLFGEEALDGVWFGTRKSGESAYWWRSHLREALAARDREIGRLRVAIRDYLEWGPMTGSDRDLFHSRFSALLARSADGAKRSDG